MRRDNAKVTQNRVRWTEMQVIPVLALAFTLILMTSCGGASGVSSKPTETSPTRVSQSQLPSPTAPSASGNVPICPASAAEAVVAYLSALDKSQYNAALGLLEHPKAVVWPAVGLVQSLLNSPAPADVVHIVNVRVPYSANWGPEVLCLSQAHISPGKEAARLGVTEQGDRVLAFWSIKRGECWRLARGGPVSEDVRELLQSGFSPFRNVSTDLSAQAARGQKFNISFEFDLHPSLGRTKNADVIEGILLLFQPEPDVPIYPQSNEQVFSIPNFSKKWPKQVRLGESQMVEGIVVGEPEVPADLQPGKYRVYLGVEGKTSIHWPMPPFVVDVR